MNKIECKYKFQNAEKFNDKAYCTCHNELCKDISFCCDNNCQIYEDYKQLKRKEQDARDFARYKQALDEIEEFCIVYSNNHNAYETVYKHILNIINKTKEEK